MQVLLAVLDDLFKFAVESLFGLKALPDRRHVERLPEPLQPLLPLLPAAKSFVSSQDRTDIHGSNFIDVPLASVRLDPVAAFDNVVITLPYATTVTVLKYGGRWAMIEFDDITGWVLKDEISSAATDVLPQFSVGTAYDAGHATTVRLRKLIKDMFACADANLPLTSVEYVTYRLLRNRRQIQWPLTRPRLPGQWQTILRGQKGIHIGIVPKTESVMECIKDETGLLLYVEAVFPDESIQVSAVDYQGLGVYTEDVFPKEVWRELRPIFIEVT